MKEFMFLIYNEEDPAADVAPDLHEEFLKKCEVYIRKLKEDGKLIAAQPIERQGKVLSWQEGNWNESSFNESGKTWVGYYHILVADLAEAVSIAKANPEFQYKPTARIEVRPVKVKEDTTGFVYPK
jgi:hypothetical protein